MSTEMVVTLEVVGQNSAQFNTSLTVTVYEQARIRLLTANILVYEPRSIANRQKGSMLPADI